MITTKELLRIAYKKLKSNVFFDKTQLPLRDKIVFFETEQFEEVLDELAEEIESTMYSNEFGEVTTRILESIDCYILPKKLENGEESSDKKGEVYFNAPQEEVKVKECQYYIDMDVLGHILGIAWILLVGRLLDEEGYENSYGNRLKENKDITWSPYLFEPYFSQYEAWRDNGLKQAQRLLQNNKNVIMMTLDFSRFYYSVNLDKNKLTEIVLSLVEDREIDDRLRCLFLTNFVCEVVERYSEIVRKYDVNLVGNRNILPIGFAPSNIISNYCLKGFDDAIIRGWNPIYYGRYVDDVLIIDKVEKNSQIYKSARDHSMNVPLAIEYYLINCDAWKKQESLCNMSKKCGLFCIDDDGSSTDDETKYIINNKFLVFQGCKIGLQRTKAKVFYFDSTKSDSLIRCFQNGLQKNISEFRYMPEDEPVFNESDYTEIYRIQKASGPNKLNGVDEFKLDKFSLSKFLGKYMRISELVEDKNELQFNKDIVKIFTCDVTIENYLAWEKIIAIFVNNGSFNSLEKFIDIVLQSVSTIKTSDQDFNQTEKAIKESLLHILYSGLGRSLSLVWGKEMSDLIHELEIKLFNFQKRNELDVARMGGIEEYRKQYCLTRMCDKYSMPFVIDALVEDEEFKLKDDDELINLTSLESFLQLVSDKISKQNLLDRDINYLYYPYIFSISDLIFANLAGCLIEGNTEKLNRSAEKLYSLYYKLNRLKDVDMNSNKVAYLVNNNVNPSQLYIKVGTDFFEKIKISVANTELCDDLLSKLLSHTYNRTYERYNNLVKLVNEAIANNSNMLILPEGYLPIGWLPIFARTCAKNQMAAVVGLEHFVVKDTVYNITATILPYMEDDYKFAYIHFHLKTHYAPHEKETIMSNHKKIGKGSQYTLFCWNDFWFPVYCCYELTSIRDRAIFQSYADAVIAVEWNMDVNHFSNIVESLARDLHCYCIQANMAKYGDSRITQPTRTERKDILRVKGGKNPIILTDEIDIKGLRDFQLLGNILQKESGKFKPTPPDFDYETVQLKKDKKLWDKLIINLAKKAD